MLSVKYQVRLTDMLMPLVAKGARRYGSREAVRLFLQDSERGRTVVYCADTQLSSQRSSRESQN